MKSIRICNFSTLSTKLTHNKLKSKLASIVDFAFKVGDKTFIRMSNNSTTYWRKNTKRRLGFSKVSPDELALLHFFCKSFFIYL